MALQKQFTEEVGHRRRMEPLNKRHVLFLLAAGAVIIPICSLFQQTQPASKGEYHFSMFLRNNLTVLAWIVYAIAALLLATSSEPYILCGSACCCFSSFLWFQLSKESFIEVATTSCQQNSSCTSFIHCHLPWLLLRDVY
jgi:hypothetical protein